DQAEQLFGSIPMTAESLPTLARHALDGSSNSITLYRDIQMPFCLMAYQIPGATHANHLIVDLLTTLLAEGKQSLLPQHLVYDKQLVRSVFAQTLGFFDHDLLLIGFQPNGIEDIDAAVVGVQQILDSIAQQNIQLDDLMKSYKIAQH